MIARRASDGAGCGPQSASEDDGLVAVADDAVFAVLFDNRPVVALFGHLVRGGADGPPVRGRADERRQEGVDGVRICM